MHLELKEKIHGLTRKNACTITREECQSIMDGCLGSVFDNRELFNSLKLEMRLSQLQPKVIIQYERTAFISPIGNVRITFDRNITASTHYHDFFAVQPSGLIPLLPTGLHVLEVKYDELISDYLLQIIQSIYPQRTAFSKYYLGRHAVRGDFCRTSYDDE